jgi:hypothetical protein
MEMVEQFVLKAARRMPTAVVHSRSVTASYEAG